MIRVGPAGWLYKDWKGVVYPEPEPKGFDPLEYITRYFDTVEVNSSFYGPPTPKTARAWLKRASGNENFRFTAKAWRRFTHERKEAWSAAEVKEARAGMDLLVESGCLGAYLLQFPWSFRRNDENREWLDDVITTFDDYPLVLEVRHSSWSDPEFCRELRERGVGFVNIDQPQFSNSIGPSASATAPVGYIRVHGRNYQDWFRDKAGRDERYDYLYTAKELKPWVARAQEIASSKEAEEVYVITNNHYRGQAVANALMVRSMLEKKKVPSPPDLIDEYSEVLKEYAVAQREAV